MNQRLISFLIIGFIGLVVIMFISGATFLTIEAGKRGVIFRRFSGGLDKENIYQPGFHVIAPWNDMYIYEVREKQQSETMTVLSNNGLNIKVDLTVRVHPAFSEIGSLHEEFGTDYMNSLVIPEIRSSARKVFGRFAPEELYSTKREEVQTMIQKDLETVLSKNHIALKAVLIRDIELPEKVRNAIEEKLQAEQTALKYEFILNQERKEAERKTIEAQAKADANSILNASLTDKILKDKGVEATLKLAESPNTKIIVIGSGDGGLPLILNGQ